jgi:5-methylcytosine-specific restriction endonuclease McrA
MCKYPYKDANESLIKQVWSKGIIIPGYAPDVYRKDKFGWWICLQDHGNTNSEYGWEIDYIIPISKSGSNEVSNLQPLFWRNRKYKTKLILNEQ